MVHRIQRGDTLWGLARRYSTTVEELRRLNPGIVDTQLVVGSVLRITEQKQETTQITGIKMPNFYTDEGWVVTSPYGIRTNPITGQPGSFHRGIDFAGKRLGEPIKTPVGGLVVRSAYNKGGYGNFIAIEDSRGFIHIFAHLHQRQLKQGDRVRKGEVIGTVGTTGQSTGVHLHYQINTPRGGVSGTNAHTCPTLFNY